MLTELQAEMSTARQFVFLRRCSGLKPEQVLSLVNETHKQLAGPNALAITAFVLLCTDSRIIHISVLSSTGCSLTVKQ